MTAGYGQGFCKYCGGWLAIRSMNEHASREECCIFLRRIIDSQNKMIKRLREDRDRLMGREWDDATGPGGTVG